jgi:hypothetical protein
MQEGAIPKEVSTLSGHPDRAWPKDSGFCLIPGYLLCASSVQNSVLYFAQLSQLYPRGTTASTASQNRSISPIEV